MMLEAGDGHAGLLTETDSDDLAENGMLQDYVTVISRLRIDAAKELVEIQKNSAAGTGQMERILQEMEMNRRQAQIQVRELPSGAERQKWERRLQDWGAEVTRIRGQVKGAKETQQREALGLDREGFQQNLAAANQAMQSTELLAQTSKKLQEAKQQALECEDIGTGVLSDLAAQRETILNVRGNMQTLSSELTSARRALERMISHAQRNRLFSMVICFILLLGLSVWGLCILGLPLKTTVLLAVGVVVFSGAAIGLYRYSTTRRR